MRKGALLVGVLVLGACPTNNSKLRAPADVAPTHAASAAARRGVVTFEPQGRTLRIDVELAETPQERERGLMYRRQLAPSAGMLFVFDAPTNQSFWMKNTYIPLDMVFINPSMQIVGIIHEAEPLTLRPRAVNQPSRYVVEVNGGFCRKHGITLETPVRFSLPPVKR